MVKIYWQGRIIAWAQGQSIRSALLRAGISPHNGRARWLNCKGMGTCGTCAIEVNGAVSALTRREKARLRFPPHQRNAGLRLACQCKPISDVTVTKHAGFWGQKLKQK